MNRAFSRDFMAATLVLQKNETAAMLVYQTNPARVQLFAYVNTSFCFNKRAWVLAALAKTPYSKGTGEELFDISRGINSDYKMDKPTSQLCLARTRKTNKRPKQESHKKVLKRYWCKYG